MKRNVLLVIAGVLIVSLLLFAGCGSGTTSTTSYISSQQQGIWVSGEGEVTAVPDVATVSIGIEVQADTVSEAQAQASQAMDQVMDALIENGVAENDIQTQYFNINNMTRWDSETGESRITGYQVTNMVTAKIRDLDTVGVVIDEVARAGGDYTRVNNISFSVDDPSGYQDEARALAIANAKEKAQQIADECGVDLGKPTYISESSYQPVTVYRDYAVASEMAAGGTTTPISAGEVDITVNVQIAYEIR